MSKKDWAIESAIEAAKDHGIMMSHECASDIVEGIFMAQEHASYGVPSPSDMHSWETDKLKKRIVELEKETLDWKINGAKAVTNLMRKKTGGAELILTRDGEVLRRC